MRLHKQSPATPAAHGHSGTLVLMAWLCGVAVGVAFSGGMASTTAAPAAQAGAGPLPAMPAQAAAPAHAVPPEPRDQGAPVTAAQGTGTQPAPRPNAPATASPTTTAALAAQFHELLHGARTPAERQQLAMALAAQAPEAFERQLAQALSHAADRALRLSTLALVRTLPAPPPAVVGAARDIVLGRNDPDMTAAALEIVRNGDRAATSPEDRSLAVAVSSLVADADPKVRAESVMLLPMVDQSRDIEPLLMRAARDTSEEVRRSAIEAVVNSGSRGEDFKQLFMSVGLDTSADPQTRIVALGALGSFRLTPQEMAALQASRRLLMGNDR